MEFREIHSKQLGETLYQGRHKSGLMIYVLPKQGYSKSYASFAARVGSVDNEFFAPGEEASTKIPDGVAHFLEHKLFEQPDGTNAFDSFSRTGASANAFTSFQTTAYIFSSTDRFYENLEILLDYVGKPHFTHENVAKEQGIIGQEIRMYDDDPGWRVFFNLLGALYEKHPVRHDIAGTVESIAEIDKDLLYKCYHTFYNPSNMILFVCGAVEKEKVAALADQYVTSSPIGEICRVFPQEPSLPKSNRTEQALSVASPLFLLGFKDDELGVGGNEMLKKQIITELLLELFAGKSSPLYQRLYEEGLINDSFEADFTCEEQYAYSTMGGESPDPDRVREEILKELSHAAVEAGELERCKKVLIGKFLRLFNGVERLSNAFVSSLFQGVDLFQYINLCEGITREEAQARLRRHFAPERAALSVIKPYAPAGQE